MHSHNQTLLAKLGFQDKDKGDPRHDLACQYLKLPEVAVRLANHIWPNAERVGRELLTLVENPQALYEAGKTHRRWWHQIGLSGAEVEKHITKGEGKYRTTIGFVDLMLKMDIVRAGVWDRREGRYDPVSRVFSDEPVYNSRGNIHGYLTLLIEVKIGLVSAGDILRQMKLYREYIWASGFYDSDHPLKAVAACAFPLSPADITALHDEGITYVHLGDSFARYCEEQKRLATEAAQSIKADHDI